MEPFFSTKPPGAGTGLGLAIVYGVVRGLGGEVRIESKVGSGTSVIATFPPAVEAEPLQRTPVPAERSTTGGKRQALALVCDDDPDVLAGTRRLLGLLGLRTEAAHVGPEAVRRFSELRPRLVVMDLDMPGMDGAKVIAKLLALDPEARILVITGYGRERLPPELAELTSLRYLSKPASLGDLSAVVDELIR
jgi:CheY-like chemotaxis protein